LFEPAKPAREYMPGQVLSGKTPAGIPAQAGIQVEHGIYRIPAFVGINGKYQKESGTGQDLIGP
jgi:hypothetical protein